MEVGFKVKEKQKAYDKKTRAETLIKSPL